MSIIFGEKAIFIFLCGGLKPLSGKCAILAVEISEGDIPTKSKHLKGFARFSHQNLHCKYRRLDPTPHSSMHLAHTQRPSFTITSKFSSTKIR